MVFLFHYTAVDIAVVGLPMCERVCVCVFAVAVNNIIRLYFVRIAWFQFHIVFLCVCWKFKKMSKKRKKRFSKKQRQRMKKMAIVMFIVSYDDNDCSGRGNSNKMI